MGSTQAETDYPSSGMNQAQQVTRFEILYYVNRFNNLPDYTPELYKILPPTDPGLSGLQSYVTGHDEEDPGYFHYGPTGSPPPKKIYD